MRYKTPIATLKIRDPSVIRRLVSKVSVDDKGCWNWTGYVNKKGYGQIKLNGKAHWVHRVSHSVFNGPIPEALTIHHTCHNPSCVNPDHLTTATTSENSKEGRGSGVIDDFGNYIPI